MSEPQIATLEEIETHYSMRDVLDAHEVLDWKDHRTRAENSRLENERELARLKRRG